MTTRCCYRCGGLLLSVDGHKECINCGHEDMNLHERHKWLQANKREIVKDYLKTGCAGTIGKWHISFRTLYKMPEVRFAKLCQTINKEPKETQLRLQKWLIMAIGNCQE